MRARSQRHPLALVCVGVVLYSTGPVFIGASEVPGAVFSFWRLWIGVPVLGVAAAIQLARSKQRPNLRAWRWALLAGLSFGAHQVCFMIAIKATSVADVALMGSLSPIIVAVAAVRLFGERPGRIFRAWTAVAMAGTAVVVIGAAGGPTGDPGGTVLALLNVVFFAGFFLVSKLGREDIGVLPFLFGVMLVAAISVTAYAAVAGEPIGSIGRRDLIYATTLAVGPGAVGHFVMTWPLRWVAANVPPVLRLAQPILSGVLAWLLLSQPITVTHLLGGTLTLIGVGGAVLSPAGRRLTARAREMPEPPAQLPS